MNNQQYQGSTQSFDANWRNRPEAQYNHWTKGAPQNQIQFAFRSHWLLFEELLKNIPGRKCLEVGCGRGSISSYFADNGYQCTLLDSSTAVLQTAQHIFEHNKHQATFIEGNALQLPFEDNSYDVIVSIGLLEHFEDTDTPMLEQYRVLKKGGLFLGYIVPEYNCTVQKYFNWVNKGLKDLTKRNNTNTTAQKDDIYRSTYDSKHYLNALKQVPYTDLLCSGVYPLPLISHSPEFPFTLLPQPYERILTKLFALTLQTRKWFTPHNPWLCKERFGQAFLIAYRKK